MIYILVVCSAFWGCSRTPLWENLTFKECTEMRPHYQKNLLPGQIARCLTPEEYSELRREGYPI